MYVTRYLRQLVTNFDDSYAKKLKYKIVYYSKGLCQLLQFKVGFLSFLNVIM